MRTSLLAGRLPALPVLALLGFLGVLLSREPSESEGLPAFLPQNKPLVHVEVNGVGLEEGVYQINDGLTLCDVIKLTQWRDLSFASMDASCGGPVINGERVLVTRKAQQINLVERGWMSAGKRMALTIPLHPDRMNPDDWVALPGIGEKLAEAIEKDRQKNGDFGGFQALRRVRGVGPKKLESWKPFFADS